MTGHLADRQAVGQDAPGLWASNYGLISEYHDDVWPECSVAIHIYSGWLMRIQFQLEYYFPACMKKTA